MERYGFTSPEELIEKVNEQLGYGDSRAEWIREAIKLRLDLEEVMEEDLSDDEPRQELLDLVGEELSGGT